MKDTVNPKCLTMLIKQFFAASVVFVVLFFSSHLGVAQVIYATNELTITAKTERCISVKNGIDHNYNLLSIENKTDHEISVQFEKELWYDDHCVTCGKNNIEHTVFITIPAGSRVQGNCQKDHRELMIFHSSNQEFIKDRLTKFELNNLNSTSN